MAPMRCRALVLVAVCCVACGSTADDARDEGSGQGGSAGAVSGSGGASATGGRDAGRGGDAMSGTGGTNTSGGRSGGGGGNEAGSTGGTQGTGGSVVPAVKAPFDWVGIIGSGQSLSTGCGTAAVGTTQPFHNLKLLDQGPDPKYPIDGSASAKWSLIPLTEPIREAVPGYGTSYEYPNNICKNSDGYGETPHSGMANALSALWAARGESGDYVTAHTVVGVGGVPLSSLNETSRSFAAALSEVRVYKALADAAGKTYGVAGIIFTHGEYDAITGNKQYGSQLYSLWQAYNTSIKAITGQTRDVVLLASQESSIEDGYDGVAVQVWRAGIDHPGQIVCTAPKYAFAAYGVHLPAPGYERIGEKYAEVFDAVVNRGLPWKPVAPNKITRSGAVITAAFDVPNPPLVWDQHLAMPHQTAHMAWAKGRGFEVKDDVGNELAIASTEIQGTNVVVTLAAAPAQGAKLTLGYAVTSDAGPSQWDGGYDGGLHGLLRDSDDFQGYALETIDVKATKGSAMLTPVTSGSFARRGSFDIVTGGGVAADTIVSIVGGDQMNLSSPWTGATGTASLTFRHDQHNYGVHFAMAVP
jgi:hypothetical protein